MNLFHLLPKSWRDALKRYPVVQRLERKLTRQLAIERISAFLEKHQTEQLTVEVGASIRRYKHLFPNTFAGDIVANYIITDKVRVSYNDLDLLFDAHDLPFADNSVPVILCTEVLEHCTNPQRVIDEFYRVLSPGGKLLLTTRFVFPLHETPHDYFRFTKYGLQWLCREFSQVTVEEEENTVETLAVLFHRLSRQSRWRLPGATVILRLISYLIGWFGGLLRAEFGDASRVRPERGIMAAGYLLVAEKQKEVG